MKKEEKEKKVKSKESQDMERTVDSQIWTSSRNGIDPWALFVATPFSGTLHLNTSLLSRGEAKPCILIPARPCYRIDNNVSFEAGCSSQRL